MKRTQLKDALRNIRKQIVSFLSIVVIALLGVTIFLGIDYSAYAMRKNGTAFYESVGFRDIETISTLLLSEQDIDAIRSTEGVADVEGVYAADAKVTAGDVRMNAIAVSATERINLPSILEGRLPENDRECAVEQRLMKQMGWKTGDTITLMNAQGEKPRYLLQDTFTICGVILHPDHIGNTMPETSYILVAKDAFDRDSLGGCYMKAEILTERQAGINRFEEPYRKGVGAVVDRLEALAETRTQIREAEVRESADRLISENAAKLADAEAELNRARTELDDGWEQLKDGERQYEEGKAELENGRKTLDESKEALSEAEAKLIDGRNELDDAKAQLPEAAAQLDAGKRELDAAKRKLVSGWNTIEDAKTQIRGKLKGALDDLLGEDSSQWIAWASPMAAQPDSSEATAGDFWILNDYKVAIGASLADKIETILEKTDISDDVLQKVFEGLGGEGDYDRDAALQMVSDRLASAAGKYQQDYDALADGCKRWDEGHKQYRNGLLQYRAALAQYNEGLAAYEEGEAQYAAGLAEYEDGLKQYEDGEAAYEQGVAKLSDARKELDEAEKTLSDGERQYADGLSQYREGLDALEEGRRSASEIGACKWITVDGYGNASFVQFGVSADNLKSMEITFALLFVLVGALVIYATVSKMVDEQRRLIGTTKALGFFNREIFLKYLLFGVSATLLGCLLGVLLGRFLIEGFILDGLLMYYDIEIGKLYFELLPTGIVLTAGALLAFFAVWFACIRLVRQPAIRLMQQSVPQGAKRSASGKKRVLSLYARLILLNIRTDLKRVLVTVVSIAGCCSLVVIGFTLRSAVENTVTLQMSDVVHYDGMIVIDPETDAHAAGNAAQILADAGVSVCAVTRTDITLRIRDLDMQELYIGDYSEMGGMIGFHDSRSGSVFAPNEDGILVSNRFSETNGISVGDSFEIALNGTKTGTVTVSGIFNNYMGRAMYMSRAYYETVFGTEPQTNVLMIRWNGAASDPLLESLVKVKGYESYQRADSFKALFESATGSMNVVVAMFIFMAAIMAGVVLTNLTNIYIMQKMPELVIMRVNGFTTREAIGYVLRETFVTTALGIVLGIAIGSVVSYRIVRSLEQSYVQFDRSINWISWLIGTAITIVFTVIVNAITLRKVRRLKLTDI